MLNKIISFLSNNKKQIDKTVSDQIGLYSTEAAFYAIISSVPFLMFLLSMLRYIIPIDFEQLEYLLSSSLPKALSYWIEKIISSIYIDSTVSLTSISAITCAWAASKSVFSLSKGFRKIYSTENNTNILFTRIFSLILTIILSISFALALLLLVFSQQLVALLQETALHPLVVFLTSPLISTLIFIVFTTLTFATLYKFLSFSKIKYRYHLPGALGASISWLLFSKIYSIYINYFSNFSITYGSLAAVVLLMVWLKFCMMILLYGAELNMLIIDKKNLIK